MSTTTSAAPSPQNTTMRPLTVRLMNLFIIALSLALIIWISIDTFRKIDFLQNTSYMRFQLWVCIFFIIDFFVEMAYAQNKAAKFRSRFFFLILSIPYLNVVSLLHIHLSPEMAYFVRFIPLARGALAMSIVIRYFSSSAINSLFMSYLVIMVLVAYFCSLIFFQFEHDVNPDVHSYWNALWWSAMNMSTVGCNIMPVTAVGKIVAVVLPCTGMVIFPLFTVYLTNYVTSAVQKQRENSVF